MAPGASTLPPERAIELLKKQIELGEQIEVEKDHHTEFGFRHRSLGKPDAYPQPDCLAKRPSGLQ